MVATLLLASILSQGVDVSTRPPLRAPPVAEHLAPSRSAQWTADFDCGAGRVAVTYSLNAIGGTLANGEVAQLSRILVDNHPVQGLDLAPTNQAMAPLRFAGMRALCLHDRPVSLEIYLADSSRSFAAELVVAGRNVGILRVTDMTR